jgi:Dynein heavy chain, N-terminal region 2
MGVKEKWLNLEVLFCNKELHVHLPSASLRKFDACRKTHHKMLKEIAKNPQVLAACCRHGNIGDLRNLLHLLEESQAAFDDYLFSKRQIFPRLYFTSDEELIQILASQMPGCLRSILKKVNTLSKAFFHFHFAAFGQRVNIDRALY